MLFTGGFSQCNYLFFALYELFNIIIMFSQSQSLFALNGSFLLDQYKFCKTVQNEVALRVLKIENEAVTLRAQ